MKLSQSRLALFVLFLLLPQHAFAADVVPFSIKRVKPVGSGYVELVGPSKISVDGKVLAYEQIKYVKRSNIDSLTSVIDSDKGCILAYSSEGYTESISVRNQSCNEILSIFSIVK